MARSNTGAALGPYEAWDSAAKSSRSLRRAHLRSAISDRMRGPGGLYNAGNLLALAAGLTIQVYTAMTTASQSTADAIWAYFFGNPGATWMTVAAIILLAAGEAYHRAWKNAGPPIVRLNRLGDLFSGFGATARTVALICFGNVPLALAAGILHAGGKFGNAALQYPAMAGRGPACLQRLFRQSALASRVPALAALAIEPARTVGTSAETSMDLATMLAVMLVCTLIWCRADWLLLRGG